VVDDRPSMSGGCARRVKKESRRAIARRPMMIESILNSSYPRPPSMTVICPSHGSRVALLQGS
jgi:hypothetical protein